MIDNPTLDLLKHESFPGLAAALRKRSHEILDRWQGLVKKHLPAADPLTIAQIRNAVPNVLAQMAETLDSQEPNRIDDLKEASANHGEMRFHQSYNLDEVLVEYGLLRPILIDEIVHHLGRDMTAEELSVLNMGVDTAMRRSATQFAAHQARQIQAANEAHSKYLSFLSHDVRAGLNGILLTTEVLTKDLGGNPQFVDSLQDLDSMRRAIMDTVATMERFLHAERFRQGKVKPQDSTVQIQTILHDLTRSAAQHARLKGVDLKVEVPEGCCAVTDRELLTLILQNLISNAVKYTQAGSVRITVEPSNDNHGVRVSVIDTGPGIAQDQLSRMFEPFIRGNTHGQPGSGLGLSIARQAAELIGAKVTARSTVGEGSTFTLELQKTDI